MKKKTFFRGYSLRHLLFAVTALLVITLLPSYSEAQIMRSIKNEIATCEIKVSSKQVVNSTSKLRGLLKRNSKTIERIKSYKPGINQVKIF